MLKKTKLRGESYNLLLVREKGLEPPRIAAQDPKSCVSTNSTTLAENLLQHPFGRKSMCVLGVENFETEVEGNRIFCRISPHQAIVSGVLFG